MGLFWFGVIWAVSGIVSAVFMREMVCCDGNWPRDRTRLTAGALVLCVLSGAFFGVAALFCALVLLIAVVIGTTVDWLCAVISVCQWWHKEIV